MTNSEVAIEAKHPESKGIVVLFEPIVELPTTSLIAHYLVAMLISVTIHMVNRQKLRLCFFAANTNRTAICTERSQFDGAAILHIVGANLGRMFFPPEPRVFSAFFPMRCHILPKSLSDSLWMFRTVSLCTLPVLFFVSGHKNTTFQGA